MGFDLVHVAVGETGRRRSGVVVGKSGSKGGEALFSKQNGSQSVRDSAGRFNYGILSRRKGTAVGA